MAQGRIVRAIDNGRSIDQNAHGAEGIVGFDRPGQFPAGIHASATAPFCIPGGRNEISDADRGQAPRMTVSPTPRQSALHCRWCAVTRIGDIGDAVVSDIFDQGIVRGVIIRS